MKVKKSVHSGAVHNKKQICTKWALSLPSTQLNRRLKEGVFTESAAHDDLENISESFVVYLQESHCDSHKWQRKRDKRQTWAFCAALCSTLEKSGCPTVCVWTLPEPRSKSYGDKSPRDTQTPPFTTEGAYFWPAYLILWRRMQSTKQYFLIQRRNRSKQ